MILCAGNSPAGEAQLMIGLSTSDLLDLGTSTKGFKIETVEMVRRGLPAVEIVLVGGESDDQLKRAFKSGGMEEDD